MVDLALDRGANLSLIVSDEHKDEDGFDVHQIRSTIYSLFDEDDDTYLAARALQVFTPGIPQIYYVGLLAGKNDIEAVEARGDGREINRHNFDEKEIASAAETEVVKRLVNLIRFRNQHTAFEGDFTAQAPSPTELVLSWENGAERASLIIDLKAKTGHVTYTEDDQEKVFTI